MIFLKLILWGLCITELESEIKFFNSTNLSGLIQNRGRETEKLVYHSN